MEHNHAKQGFLQQNKKIFVLILVYFTFFLIVSTFMLVKLNQPAGKVSVPDVTGKQFDLVYNSLIKKELKPELKFFDATDVDSGLIVRQYPAAGRVVSRGNRIVLTVSRNIEKVEVPDLVGSSLVIAKNKLETINVGAKNVSLETGVISYMPSSEHGENVVIMQSPKAGERLSQGQKVNLLVSMGGMSAEMSMPELVGQHVDLAFDLLLSKGFVVQEEVVAVDSVEESGKILEQSIEPGASFASGDILNLKVGFYDRDNFYYQAYEHVSFLVPKNSGEGLYEAIIVDDLAQRVRFSKVCKPGEKFEFVFARKGGAKVEITLNKEKIKVLRIDK